MNLVIVQVWRRDREELREEVVRDEESAHTSALCVGKYTKEGGGGYYRDDDSLLFFRSERGVRRDRKTAKKSRGVGGGGGEGCGTLLTHASAPRSLSAQHPMLLSISSGNNSGPTALFCACSINSIL
jgi:hypothetical protein